jgi:flagellar biosynthetic protein FliR
MTQMVPMVHMTEELPAIVHDWPQFLAAGVLVLMRVSGLLAFAPIFGSSAIAPRIKAGMAFAITLLLAPTVTVVPGARASLDASAILGELGIGMALGLFLMLLTESLAFAGMLIGMQFSFSLVNLLDPNTMIETPVLGQMLNWLGIMVLIHAGLDRSLLNALLGSFRTVPVGRALLPAGIGVTLAHVAGTVFVSGLQLAAPVMAAALTVEVTIALVGRLSPQLPAMVVSIPLKTIASYVVLIGSLALWPGWIEAHFSRLLGAAEKAVVR